MCILMWVCTAKVGFNEKSYRRWELRKRKKNWDKREKERKRGEGISKREIKPWSFMSMAFIWPWQNLTKANVIAVRLFSPLGYHGMSWRMTQLGKWACNIHMLTICVGVVKCSLCSSLSCTLLAVDLDSLLVVHHWWS